jgi:hypothetical protein
MSASTTAAATFLCLSALSELAHADAEACASAYSRGQEERLAGRLYSARSAFQVCSDAACPAAIASDCRRWTSEVEKDLPTIRVRVTDTHGVAIHSVWLSSDGVEIPSAQLMQPIIVEAGPHTLHFEAPGYQALDLQASLRPSDREQPVNAVLRPLAASTTTPSAPSRQAVPLTLAALGTIAFGTSLYFGLSARSQYDDLKASCAPNCAPAQADSVREKALISDVALLGSALAVGAAAWLYFGASKDRPRAALNLEPHVDGAALRVRLFF